MKLGNEDIIKAMTVIDNFIEELDNKKSVNKNETLKFIKSYIQSFGPAIINNGLYPAIAFYEKNAGNSAEKTYYIMRMIRNMIVANDEERVEILEKSDSKDNVYRPLLLEYLMKESQDYKDSEYKIKKATIALKNAIRLYVQTEKGD